MQHRVRTVAVAVALVVPLALSEGDRVRPEGVRPASSAAAADRSPAAGGSADRAAARPVRPVAGPGHTEQGATPPVTAPPASVTLVATGDVLLHSPLWRQAERDAAALGRPGMDFAPLLSGIRPTVEAADLAICHMETPVAPAGGPYSGYPSFSVPPEIVPALAETGYDACTTASNHSFDRGADGVDRTVAAFEAAGLAHAGTARSPAEAQEITLVEAGEATVALLSYTYGFNGIPAPGGETWRANPIDEADIVSDASRARDAGADIVVVALHWGLEYQHEPTAEQAALGPRLLSWPDVDLVVGHHAHVVQPIQEHGGKWIVYGMGNSVAAQASPGTAKEEGLLVRFTFTDGPDGWHVTGAEYDPTLIAQSSPPMRLVETARALADPATPAAVRGRLQQAQDRTAGVVASLGALDAGLVPLQP
jgi:poly-gamma-glutamate synthesis protein (capsule biosynthesis protein)